MKSSMAIVVSLAAVLAAVMVQAPAAFAAEVDVSITVGSSTKTTDSYAPNPVEINVGDTVTWTNDDSQAHTATSGTPSGGADGIFGGQPGNAFTNILQQGQTMSHTFTEAGEFPYFCALHPNMVGTVIVSAGNGGNGGEPAESTATVEHEDQSYTITAMSAETSLTDAEIVPGESVRLQFDGPGEVELTLPIGMISSIDGISANGSTVEFEPVGEGADSMTISFTVPESGEVEISGAVVPEFGIIAILVLAASFVAVIGVARFKGNSFSLGRL